ncbi:hypothetical protein FIBSPDRAFT_894311 [Athelia psychrophila]|uniref:Uncharacterized protein n=1 Tax=Athelia psychrophila TaxID=1759441 RepID=A0A166G1Z5_9AGAM|nr:hypothetical protein FIBSPDRAFT_894311 [Fibularhizoctonia sp. CBS 109695]
MSLRHVQGTLVPCSTSKVRPLRVTELVLYTGGLEEEEPIEGVGIVLPQDNDVASLASSVEQLEQMDPRNTASADAIMEVGEHSEYVLFVGSTEWTREPMEQEDDYEFYVDVKVDDSREVHHTMSTDTTHWDQYFRITGHLSSIVSIEIKGSVRNSTSSEIISIARATTSLGNLLEMCPDDDGVWHINAGH